MDMSDILSILRAHLEDGSKDKEIEAIKKDLMTREFDSEEYRQFTELYIETTPKAYEEKAKSSESIISRIEKEGLSSSDEQEQLPISTVNNLLEVYRMLHERNEAAQRLYFEIVSSFLGAKNPQTDHLFLAKVDFDGPEKIQPSTVYLGNTALMLTERFQPKEYWLGPDTYIPDYTVLPLAMVVDIQVPSTQTYREMIFLKRNYDFSLFFGSGGKSTHQIADAMDRRQALFRTLFDALLGTKPRSEESPTATHHKSIRLDFAVKKGKESKEEYHERVANIIQHILQSLKNARNRTHDYSIISLYYLRRLDIQGLQGFDSMSLSRLATTAAAGATYQRVHTPRFNPGFGPG